MHCRHIYGNRCRFSNTPYNYCLQAHSEDELNEWKERYEWRMMKKEVAKKFQHLYSYMDRLLDDYSSSLSKTSVVSKDEILKFVMQMMTNFSLSYIAWL